MIGRKRLRTIVLIYRFSGLLAAGLTAVYRTPAACSPFYFCLYFWSPAGPCAGAGLFTSPHLLEVTERVRLDGKPLSKEAFATCFFQVWDRLQATRGRSRRSAEEEHAEGPLEVAEMPGYFHLLTLVG